MALDGPRLEGRLLAEGTAGVRAFVLHAVPVRVELGQHHRYAGDVRGRPRMCALRFGERGHPVPGHRGTLAVRPGGAVSSAGALSRTGPPATAARRRPRPRSRAGGASW